MFNGKKFLLSVFCSLTIIGSLGTAMVSANPFDGPPTPPRLNQSHPGFNHPPAPAPHHHHHHHHKQHHSKSSWQQ